MNPKCLHVGVVGIKGLPAEYGGFETLVENLVRNSTPELEYSVVCSSNSQMTRIMRYRRAKLLYLPIPANGPFSVLYDFLGMLRLLSTHVLLVLGVSGALALPFLKLIYRGKIVVNIDGQEWKRRKWKGFAKLFLRVSEYISVKFATMIIADNLVVYDYVWRAYGKKPIYIAYGGDHAKPRAFTGMQSCMIPAQKYAFCVCRIEPENNIDIILEAFSDTAVYPIMIVGNWSSTKYGKAMLRKFGSMHGIYLIDAIYDQERLDSLRSNARVYIHGHSAGGTNPSLVEAMSLGLPIVAFDVDFNRSTTLNSCKYFKNSDELRRILCTLNETELKEIGQKMKKIADENYKWQQITKKYEEALNLACFDVL